MLHAEPDATEQNKNTQMEPTAGCVWSYMADSEPCLSVCERDSLFTSAPSRRKYMLAPFPLTLYSTFLCLSLSWKRRAAQSSLLCGAVFGETDSTAVS